ncbi:MAG: hypothetical protein HC808_12050 [Candidatus Competibacteraceae bacterium]|nr:hypothetical protein [Candidatus Competibacteraceae bacterium]
MKSIPLLRKHTVFHASQIDGILSLEEVYGPVEALPDHQWRSDDQLEAIIKRSGARLIHEGNRAVYRPSSDLILMPPRDGFPIAPLTMARCSMNWATGPATNPA